MRGIELEISTLHMRGEREDCTMKEGEDGLTLIEDTMRGGRVDENECGC